MIRQVWSSAALVGSVLMGLSPFSYIFMVEQAYIRNALEHQTYLILLVYGKILAAPGHLLTGLIGFGDFSGNQHSQGTLFLQELSVFLCLNILGWLLVILGLKVVGSIGREAVEKIGWKRRAKT